MVPRSIKIHHEDRKTTKQRKGNCLSSWLRTLPESVLDNHGQLTTQQPEKQNLVLTFGCGPGRAGSYVPFVVRYSGPSVGINDNSQGHFVVFLSSWSIFPFQG